MTQGYYDGSYPPSIFEPPAPPVVPATGATAGAPGVWTPPGSTPPASVSGAGGVTASPDTPWTTGQYMQGALPGAPGQMTWSGSAWVGGKAP